ncbi:MAG: DUF4159 domain-containing protein [Planctomycetota bacterium]
MVSADEPAVTDASVEAAIRRGVAWLQAQRKAEGHWEQNNSTADIVWGGDTGLALLALLYAGEDPRTEAMDESIEWLSYQTLNGTYTYGTRAHVLARVPGEKFRQRLEDDLDWLVTNIWPTDSDNPGAYDYTALPDGRTRGKWDNSNSQYGVLGVWMATDAGLTAPLEYWQLVGQHWTRHQQSDGGWTYRASGQSTGSMTAAGLATLFVVLDRIYGDNPKDAVGLTSAINSGLTWLGREYTPENPFGDRMWLYYYLYGVERAGRASGYKYFRNKDWFREGAAFLLSKQEEDGSWRGSGELMSDLRNTSFALMFLCHGRAPLLFNKLEHGSDWNNKLRDVAGITHYAERTLERLLNWQIVRLDGSMDDLMEAPVLYLGGQEAWEFSEVDVQKIREYCLRGGMVLAVTGRGGNEFAESVQALAERAFGEYRVRPMPSDHPLFSGEVQFVIEKPPSMFEVHNGVRSLMLICTDDIAEAWNRGRGRREHLKLGCNIYNYATDKTTLRSRLQTANIPLRQVDTVRKIKVALIKYDGPWNVEPYGWTRLKNYMNNEAKTRLLVTSGLAFDSPDLDNFKIAYITGTEAFQLSDAEKQGLRNFLRGGGTLLADAAGGRREFTEALEAHLTEALRAEPARLEKDSFLFTGNDITDAVNLAGVAYARTARGSTRGEYPPLRAYRSGRRLAVIYSPLDLSAGLLGTHVFDRRGYEGDSPLRIMRNLLLYADLPTREKARLARQ